MTNHPNRSTNILDQGHIRYIVMDAEGHYGNYCQIYSSHDRLEDALRRRGRKQHLKVCDDGGWNATHQRGSMIHRQFARGYRQY
jgi:hypothetical protein